MAYQDEWNLIIGSKAYAGLSAADKRKLARIFAREVVAPEVGGGKSPEMRAFIEAYVAPKPKAEKGGFLAEAGRGFQDEFGKTLAGSLYNLDQRMRGGQEIRDTSVAVEPSLLGPLGRATGAVVGSLADPIGLAIDYATGRIGGRLLAKGVQSVNPVRSVAATVAPGAVSGAIQAGGTAAAQGGDGLDTLQAGLAGLALGGAAGRYYYGKNAPLRQAGDAVGSTPTPAAPQAVASGPTAQDRITNLSTEQLAVLRNRVARQAADAGIDFSQNPLLAAIDAELTRRGPEVSVRNRADFAAQADPAPVPPAAQVEQLSLFPEPAPAALSAPPAVPLLADPGPVRGLPAPGQTSGPISAGGAIAQPPVPRAMEGYIPQSAPSRIKSLSDTALQKEYQTKLKQLRAVEAKDTLARSQPPSGMRVKGDPERFSKTIEKLQAELAELEQEMLYRSGATRRTPVSVDEAAQPTLFGLPLDPNRAVDAGAAPSAATSPAAQPSLVQRILADEEGGAPIPDFRRIAELLETDIGPKRAQAANAAQEIVEGPRTPSGEKYAANINLNRLDVDDSVKATIESVAQSYKGQIDEARRGVITHEETLRMADELGISAKKILSRKAGEAWNAEQLLAARQVMASTAAELDGLAQKVIDGQATDMDKILFMDALQRHAAIQAEVAGATAEAGRALSQFRIAVKAGKAIPDIQSLMDELGGAGRIEDIAAAIKATPDGPQRAKLIRDLQRAKPTDVLSELFINSILSGPRTHITNAVGNAITVATRMVETAVAAGVGKAGELAGAGPASTKFGEVVAQAYGALQGLKEGAKLAAQVYRTGRSSGTFAPHEIERPGAISSQRLGLTGTPGKVVDQVGKVVRIPGRALLSADEFFKSIHYRMELHSQAYRQAADEGLKGPALAERVADLVDNPSESMLEKARESAAYHTFNKPLKGDDPFTTVARSLSSARANAPSISFIVPFIRTPVNILKYAGERTPLAPLSKAIREDIKAGGARREQALSRIAVGTILGASVLAYALEGHITGGGPTDPREREALRATGWQPYSIKVGDTYVSFQRLAPFGMIAGAAADVADILQRSRSNDEKFNAVAALLTAVANNATSQTFLQGLTDFMEVFQDPDRYAGGYVGGFARALVPNVIRQAASAADPVVRDTRGDGGLVDSIVGGVISGLPLSTSLPEKLDPFGQPIVREQASVGPLPASLVSYLNPFYVSRDRNDPVRDELYRLRVFVGPPKNTDGLPEDQFEQFVRSSGQDAYQLLSRIIASRAYKDPNLTDEDRAEILRRAMRLSRTRSRRRVPRI